MLSAQEACKKTKLCHQYNTVVSVLGVVCTTHHHALFLLCNQDKNPCPQLKGCKPLFDVFFYFYPLVQITEEPFLTL